MNGHPSETAGWSSMCVAGNPHLCKAAKARCTNPQHGPGGQQPPAPKPKEPTMPQPQPRALRPVDDDARPRAVVRLVKSTPPSGGRGASVVPRIEALLDQVKDQPGEWFQVATWPSKTSANSVRKTVEKRHADFEFASRSLPDGTGSGLWAMFPDPDAA